MLTTKEALAELERLESIQAELLGLDGFRLEPDGRFEAPIALIIDFTASYAPSYVAAERYAEARRLIIANEAPHIRWEIVSGLVQS